jgi:hypothetical protein
MSALVRMSLAVSTMLALTACVGFPAYQGPAPGAPSAVVDIHRINASSICTDGKFYSIPSANGGKLLLPATGRIGLYSFVSIVDYNVSYTCAPGLSFQPEPGQEYLMNLETDGEGCKLEVYRKSDANRIGLELEPSVGPGAYCR